MLDRRWRWLAVPCLALLFLLVHPAVAPAQTRVWLSEWAVRLGQQVPTPSPAAWVVLCVCLALAVEIVRTWRRAS